MPQGHNRHPNKRVKVKERAMHKAQREKGIQVLDRPIPLIDIGIDRISELINSVIDEHFEDTRQDAWVRILGDHVGSEEDVLQIAREVNREHRNRAISKKYKEASLEAPINSKRDPFGKSFTLLDLIPSPPIIRMPSDETNDLTTRIFRSKDKFIESEGACISCDKTNQSLLNGLCKTCWDSGDKERHRTRQRLYYLQHKDYYRNYGKSYHPIRYKIRVELGICLRCSKPVLLNHRYCAIHLAERRYKDRIKGKERCQFRKAHHLCYECGALLSNGKSRCDNCLAKRREGKNKLYSPKSHIIETLLPQMIKLAKEGKNLYEIGQVLHCGKNTPYRHKIEICQALKGQGITYPAEWKQPPKVVIPFKDKLPDILRYINEGYTQSFITKQLHLGKSVFHRHKAEIEKELRRSLQWRKFVSLRKMNRCPPHRWEIDRNNIGHCLDCNEIKDFKELLQLENKIVILKSSF